MSFHRCLWLTSSLKNKQEQFSEVKALEGWLSISDCHPSTRMAADQADFPRTLSRGKPTKMEGKGGASEFYGIPVRRTR